MIEIKLTFNNWSTYNFKRLYEDLEGLSGQERYCETTSCFLDLKQAVEDELEKRIMCNHCAKETYRKHQGDCFCVHCGKPVSTTSALKRSDFAKGSIYRCKYGEFVKRHGYWFMQCHLKDMEVKYCTGHEFPTGGLA
jgi:hypothetical protein